VSGVAAVTGVDRAASAAAHARRDPAYTVRCAVSDDAAGIHSLIARHLDEGHLLPRRAEEVAVHASRFIVAVSDEEEIVGCVDLAPLSRTVAEIRSLVVGEDARSAGIGRRLIEAVLARATSAGFDRVCAFTHAPSYFVQHGFSLVPHDWLPEKIRTDCGSCSLFRKCGQYAVMLPLTEAQHSSTAAKALVDRFVPLASLHG